MIPSDDEVTAAIKKIMTKDIAIELTTLEWAHIVTILQWLSSEADRHRNYTIASESGAVAEKIMIQLQRYADHDPVKLGSGS